MSMQEVQSCVFLKCLALLDFASDSGYDEDLQEHLEHHFAKLFKSLAASGTNLFFELVSTRAEEKAWEPAAPGKQEFFRFHVRTVSLYMRQKEGQKLVLAVCEKNFREDKVAFWVSK